MYLLIVSSFEVLRIEGDLYNSYTAERIELKFVIVTTPQLFN